MVEILIRWTVVELNRRREESSDRSRSQIRLSRSATEESHLTLDELMAERSDLLEGRSNVA